MLTAWVTAGGLLVILSRLEFGSWLPGVTGLVGLGVWAAGVLVLGSTPRAIAIEAAFAAALRKPGVRSAAIVLGALWLLIADLLGVHAALILLIAAGVLCVLAAARSAQLLAATLVNGAISGVSLILTLFALEGLFHIPAVATRFGTPAERQRWFEQRYDRSWQRNAFGFRSPHETVARDMCTPRILAFGDSFTWGDKIANSADTWPARLEQMLSLELPRHAIEVINMGRNGFTTANEAELLRRIGWSFDPDAVIVQYYRNDVLPSGPNFQREPGTYVTPSRTLLPGSFRQGRIASSALLDVLEARYSIWRNRAPVDPLFGLYEDGTKGWEQAKDALHEMATSAAERGVPVYFVLFPDLIPGTWRPDTHPDRMIHRRVIGVAENAGMRIVDLTPVFGDGRTDARSWWATRYDGHPNEQAHDVAAKTLRDVLLADGTALERGKVQPCPQGE